MVRSVRVQIGNAQLASGLFNRAGLFDQGRDGITHDLVAGSIVSCNQLVVVLAFKGVVDHHLDLGFSGFQVGLEGGVGSRIGFGHQRRQARAADLGAVRAGVLAR